MCRLAAFPPGTTSELAHEVMANFVGRNEDGVGSCYIDPKLGFVLQKYPISYKEALVKGQTLFDHLPHAGWTLAHVRLATHGKETVPNTHPIIRGDTAVVHNGVWSKHALVKAALGGSVKWQGETDSEVGAYLLNQMGPEKFYTVMSMGDGVWLGLHRNGTLHVAKLSGDLEITRMTNDAFLLASEVPSQYTTRNVNQGWYRFDKEGHPIDFSVNEKSYEKWNNRSWNQRTYDTQDIGFMGQHTSVRNVGVHADREKRKEEFRKAQETSGQSAKKLLEIWGDFGWDDGEMAEYVRGLT